MRPGSTRDVDDEHIGDRMIPLSDPFPLPTARTRPPRGGAAKRRYIRSAVKGWKRGYTRDYVGFEATRVGKRHQARGDSYRNKIILEIEKSEGPRKRSRAEAGNRLGARKAELRRRNVQITAAHEKTGAGEKAKEGRGEVR